MASSVRIDSALDRLRQSRAFLKAFLEDLTPAEWFWTPTQPTTHIAWQVAHIAVSEYSLCLRRIRGRIVGDEKLVSDDFLKMFGLGSKPSADPAQNPPLVEIQRVFDSVHEQALNELTGQTDEALDVPLPEPHPRFKTKLGAIDYAPMHAMVHAGQVALLRRLMGKAPLR